ncbi:MAG: hypothetical protein ACFFD5_00615 [Candidatus Thorarchaeota archaeon]
MPDEFDFKNYKSMEEFSKTLEGTKYLHNLYLKAVNNPTRREILEIINNAKRISKENLIKMLIEKELIKDEYNFDYNINYLIKAFCVDRIEEGGKIFFEITQSGKVVEYLK